MSVVNVPQQLCSCGRNFLNGISLERHQWVTKHVAAETIVPAADQKVRAAQAALAQAMRVLKEKQALQQQFDHKRRQKRRLRRQLMHIEQGVEQLVEMIFANVCNLGGQSVMLVGRLVVLLGVISSLVAAGMQIGTYFPG